MPVNPNKIDYSGGFPPGFESFSIIEDPRSGGNTRHHFGEVLFMIATAMLCGMNTTAEVEHFVHLQREWFNRWITLPNGIPRQQTFGNILAMIEPKEFSKCLNLHIGKLFPQLEQQLIAIDGKSLRGSHGLKSSSEHAVSAWAAESGVTLALEYTSAKSNEITAIPKVLKAIDLSGQLITCDAMGTQRDIAEQIQEQGADYLMALKGNQGSLHKEVIDQFEFASRQLNMRLSDHWDYHKSVEKANGRITKRSVAVTSYLDWMDQNICRRWKSLRSLIMVESQTTSINTDKVRTRRRFYISSKVACAQEFEKWVRSHWSIENQCHWVLDTCFREDHNQTKAGNLAKNLGFLRRVALNLLKVDTTHKESINKKRTRAMLDCQYREHLLSLI